MYWGDAYLRKIEMANIDGSGRKSLVTERTGQYFGFTVHAGNIYFTDWKIAYVYWFLPAVTAKPYSL